MPAEPLTCVLVDDHPAVLDSISRFLTAQGVVVSAAVATGEQAFDAIERTRPAVAVVDMEMPRLNGIDLCRRITSAGLETRVIVYTGYADGAHAADAVEAGVRGFVVKDAPLSELVRAIGMVADGRPYIDPTLATPLLGGLGEIATGLTPRERELVEMLAEGLTTEETGRRLGVSRAATQVRIAAVMRKLGAETRAQAVAMALRQGWIT